MKYRFGTSETELRPSTSRGSLVSLMPNTTRPCTAQGGGVGFELKKYATMKSDRELIISQGPRRKPTRVKSATGFSEANRNPARWFRRSSNLIPTLSQPQMLAMEGKQISNLIAHPQKKVEFYNSVLKEALNLNKTESSTTTHQKKKRTKHPSKQQIIGITLDIMQFFSKHKNFEEKRENVKPKSINRFPKCNEFFRTTTASKSPRKFLYRVQTAVPVRRPSRYLKTQAMLNNEKKSLEQFKRFAPIMMIGLY